MSLLSFEGVTKRYPGVTALDCVDLEVEAGTIHALVGENGAGKSTLLKILSGAERADSGVVRLAGKPLRAGSPREMLRHGVTVVYQEFALVPVLSADANIFLGMEPQRSGLLDPGAARAAAACALTELGAGFDAGTEVARLSTAQCQLVELARALVRDARVVALDEPTAALSPREADHLFERMRAMAERGLAVIFVSHRLKEVRAVASSITVLRDGRRVWSGAAEGIDDAGLIRRMVGRDVEYQRVRAWRPSVAAGAREEAVLKVARLSRPPGFEDVSLELRRGEILGLGGLVGAGRTELARCLAGADRWTAGDVRLRGAQFRPRSPREAIAAGVGYVPEDRKSQGLVLGLPVRENIVLAALRRFSRLGVLKGAEERDAAGAHAEAVNLSPAVLERAAATLSGGNQQKTVLAKWLLADAEVLMVDEPTRGIDVGAKVEIHRQLRTLADRGKAVLVISSEIPELLALADRIVVMCEGRVTGEFPAETATADEVLAAALPSGRAA